MAVENSIIVANFNTKDALAKMLTALELEHATTAEVIVVDSASFDGSAEMVRERFPIVQLIELKENRGWPAAANAGLNRALAATVVLCHSDIVAPIHNLLELADKVREGEGRRIAAVLPQLVDKQGEPLPMVGRLPGIGMGTLGVFNPGLARKRSVPALDHVQDHEWATLACVAFNAEMLAKAGEFDERFFQYYADADMFMRLHEKLYRIAIRRDVHVVHTGDNPNEPVGPAAARIMRKDQEKYFAKHRPGWQQGVLKLSGKLKKDAG
jgi:GT2 family glycosyltransferase